MLTTRNGCPAVGSVYEGNTADASTLIPEVKKLREEFRFDQVMLVGDRSMILHKR